MKVQDFKQLSKSVSIFFPRKNNNNNNKISED